MYDRSMGGKKKRKGSWGRPVELEADDPRFPFRLLSIPDPPGRLYVLGDQAVLKLPGVAVIGTRSPSDYGGILGERVAEIAARAGYCIVSGLASGCDTAAHRAAVRLGRPTAAILPGGFEHLFPAENTGLAGEILASGGALVSEYPPDTEPEDRFFGERDRLQSGLSLGVMVIETDVNSGTLVTVGHALKQGRPIACLNTHPAEYRALPSFRGNRELLAAAAAEGEIFSVDRPADIGKFLRMLRE